MHPVVAMICIALFFILVLAISYVDSIDQKASFSQDSTTKQCISIGPFKC